MNTQEKTKFKMTKKKMIILAGIVVIAAIIVATQVIIPWVRYNNATNLMRQESYAEAYEEFSSLSEYKDSKEQANKALLSELNSTVLFYEGETDTSVWSIKSKNEESRVFFFDFSDFSNPSKNSKKGTIQLKDDCIEVKVEDSLTLQIPYKIEDGNIVITDEKCMTKEDVKKNLQGTWYETVNTKMNKKDMRYLNFEEDTLTVVKAYGNDTETGYAYYGPYTGDYSIALGKFKTSVNHGKEFYWAINDGNVVIYDSVSKQTLTKTDDSIPSESEMSANYSE